MAIDWTPFVELVQRHQRFTLMTHIRPDGDALGSELGMADILEQLGKTVRIVIASMLPARYRFLDPQERIHRFRSEDPTFASTDVIIVLDTGTWNQLGDFGPFMKSLAVPKVVIDHHRTQDDLGGIQLVDVNAEASGRLVWEASRALNVRFRPEAANAVFMALATDTGWFRHSNTTPETFALASELTKAGANPTKIYQQLYEENTLSGWKFVSRILDRLTLLANGRLCYTEVHAADYSETGAILSETPDLTDYPRTIQGVEVSVVFSEQPAGGIKVSFRSRELDVSKVAEVFGGGGHRLAAGASLTTSDMQEAKKLVLDVVLKAMA